MVDAAVNVRPSVVDVGIETDFPSSRGQSPLNNTPNMIGVKVGADAPMKTKKTAKKVSKKENDEIFEQKRAKQTVAELFEFYPILADLRIHPFASTRRQLTRYYIGKDANTYQVKSNKLVLVPSIDWNETFDHIGEIMKYDKRFLSYVKEENECGEMNFEDENTPYQLWKRIGAKRKRVNASAGDDANRSKQRLQDSFEFDNSTSTQSDEMSSKLKMLWTISKNKEMLESNGLKKKIVPVLIGTTKTSPMDEDGYVWIDGNSISVFSKSSDRVKPAITKMVNWQATLHGFISTINDKGLELAFIGKKDEERIVKDFKPGEARSEPRHGVLSGIDEDMDPKLTNADSDAKQILTEYYKILQEKRVKIPFRLKPMLMTRKSIKAHSEYYFSEPMIQRPLNIRNGQHKPVSGNAWKELMKNIRWMDTFTSLLNGLEEIEHYLDDKGDHHENPLPMDDKEATAYSKEKKLDKVRRKNLEDNLAIINEAILKNVHDIRRQGIEEYDHDDQMQKLHDASEAAFKEYGEALTRLEEAKKLVKSSNSKPARSALKAATSAMKATKAVYNSKFKQYSDAVRDKEKQEDGSQFAGSGLLTGFPIRRKLKGRGLRGAGIAPLEGVVRRSRTYNLNEIQGLATPSAYVYRQLGSKYIRIPDLDSKTLVVVQPNRRKCGPKREISGSLQELIRTLAFKQQIDQAAYDKLSIDDKKLFKEILAITHLQYNFHDRLEDPLESLKAEYDKLKGELELGNDNPSIIKQLKSLSVDMYSNRLISDSEFKDIIVRLI